MNNTIHNVVILGSGPAGLTAALYTARANLQPIVLEGPTPGGQLIRTSEVNNWPGIPSIFGAQLIMQLKDHAQKTGAQFLAQTATHITPGSVWTITTNKQQTLQTKTIIVAVGSVARQLGCPGEQEYWGKGVTICAICDGALYRNKPVIIVGGGDTAMEDAALMATFTDRITIVHQHESLTASATQQRLVIGNPNITIRYRSTISTISGDGNHVTHATIKNIQTHTEETVPTAALFLAIGSKPNTDFLKDVLELTPTGHVKTQYPSTLTSHPTVFACGDVVDRRYRQAITASAGGCMAALDAQWYLEKHG
jgi:thioredoxin reductase (NADPH)